MNSTKCFLDHENAELLVNVSLEYTFRDSII